MTRIAQAVRDLEAAEDIAGRHGHTDEAHARIVAATEAVRVEARRQHLREIGFDIPDAGSLAAIAKLTDINGSD